MKAGFYCVTKGFTYGGNRLRAGDVWLYDGNSRLTRVVKRGPSMMLLNGAKITEDRPSAFESCECPGWASPYFLNYPLPFDGTQAITTRNNVVDQLKALQGSIEKCAHVMVEYRLDVNEHGYELFGLLGHIGSWIKGIEG